MSTSPETSPSPSPSSSGPLLGARGRRALRAGGWALAVAAFVWAVPWGRLGSEFLERRGHRKAHAELLAEARSLNLSYEAVASNPAAQAGRPVLWCVDHPAGGGSAYVAGRPAWPVALSDAGSWPVNSPTTGGRCDEVLAVVVPGAGREIALRFVAFP